MHAAPSATLHAQMDSAGDGLVTLQPWCDLLSNRQTADILKSRGIDESQVRERVPWRWCGCGCGCLRIWVSEIAWHRRVAALRRGEHTCALQCHRNQE